MLGTIVLWIEITNRRLVSCFTYSRQADRWKNDGDLWLDRIIAAGKNGDLITFGEKQVKGGC